MHRPRMKYGHVNLSILLQLGYGLRTLNTLSQVTGYPNYRVSIYMWAAKYYRGSPSLQHSAFRETGKNHSCFTLVLCKIKG